MVGSETTNLALKWAPAEIINHPNVLNKLREDVTRVVGLHRLVEDSDVPELPNMQAVAKESLRLHPPTPLLLRGLHRLVEDSDVPELPNMQAVAKESLRLHPPTPLLLRNCKQDCKIHNNNQCICHAIRRDPGSWKYPTEFMPERFLDSSVGNQHEVDKKGQNLHHLPFGVGSRSCPGTNLALNVMHMVIRELVHCFGFEVKGERIMIDMEEASSGVNAGMTHPLVYYPIIKLLNPLEITTLAT